MTRSIVFCTWIMLSTIVAADDNPRWNPPIPAIGSINLLPNAGFELGKDGWSSLGKPTAWAGDLCGLFGEIQEGGAFEGQRCLRVDLGPGKTLVTHSAYSYYGPEKVVQSSPLAANLGWMNVTVGQSYTLSAYMRADKDDVPTKMAFRFGEDFSAGFGDATYSKSVKLTTQWKRYTFTMAATKPDVYIQVGPDLSATPNAAATVWIDAVQVEQGDATAFLPRESVEIGLDSGHFGNVFDAGEPVQLTVSAVNTTGDAARVVVRAQLSDYFGTVLPETSVTVAVPANGALSTLLSLNTAGLGYYRANVSWDVGGVSHERTIKLAVIEPYPHQDSPFGTNHAPVVSQRRSHLKKMDITWARTWALHWDRIEPTRGTYDYSVVDPLINSIKEDNLHTLALLPPQPSTSWASEAPTDKNLDAPHRWAYAPRPDRRTDLNNFIDRSVRRYADRIVYWEFLNEALWVEWACLPTSGGYTMSSYISLLKEAYATMKAADPACYVLGGPSIEPHMAMATEFIREGGLDYVDIYNLHPYAAFATPESFIGHMEGIQAAMGDAGGRKPIWATEASYYGTDDKPWTPWVKPDTWAARLGLSTERMVADYSIRWTAIIFAHGVEKIFWHSGVEGEVNCGSWDMEIAFLDPEATPQKLYAAHSTLANMLGPAPAYAAPLTKPDTVGDQSTSEVYGYAFEGAEQAVMIVWAPGSKRNGEGEAAGVVGLGESPIYVTNAAGSARELAQTCTVMRGEQSPWALKVPEGLNAYTIVGVPFSKEINPEPVLVPDVVDQTQSTAE